MCEASSHHAGPGMLSGPQPPGAVGLPAATTLDRAPWTDGSSSIAWWNGRAGADVPWAWPLRATTY